MRGGVITIVMVVGSLILVGVALFFVYKYWVAIRYSNCWGNLIQELGELNTGFKKLVIEESVLEEVKLGDCVNIIIFTNNKELCEWKKETGFIIAIPVEKTGTQCVGECVKEIVTLNPMECINCLRELGVKPECKVLNKKFNFEDKRFEGNKHYCFKLIGAGEMYDMEEVDLNECKKA